LYQRDEGLLQGAVEALDLVVELAAEELLEAGLE
jgi:hypothetical protein